MTNLKIKEIIVKYVSRFMVRLNKINCMKSKLKIALSI